MDPDPDRLPTSDVVRFCAAIIEATQDLVCAYKPNFAFFEQLGVDGLRALDAVRRRIPDDVLAIADAKRGDIGHTAAAYARAIYISFGFDAVTVSPYL
ncbi:MAG: orotidine 5'-phosphate decarboxylase, partial [Dehalococcoidia bacterium]|nr:orotidine 5'-phosphate decarboxylase [Dehalococcoidia bacterium]